MHIGVAAVRVTCVCVNQLDAGLCPLCASARALTLTHGRMPLFLLQPALASLVAPSGIQSHRWIRAGGQQSIAYEVAAAGPTKAPPVLLLNGFGVGSFHWHRVMGSIASESGSACYGMDYLGQGGSWPVDCADGAAPSEAGLRGAVWKARPGWLASG